MNEAPVARRTFHDIFAQSWVLKVASGGCEIQKLSRWAVMERRKHTYRYRLVQDGEVVVMYDTKEQMIDALRKMKVPLKQENRRHADSLLRRLETAYDSEEETPAPAGTPTGSGRRRGHSHNPAYSSRGDVRAPRPGESSSMPQTTATCPETPRRRSSSMMRLVHNPFRPRSTSSDPRPAERPERPPMSPRIFVGGACEATTPTHRSAGTSETRSSTPRSRISDYLSPRSAGTSRATSPGVPTPLPMPLPVQPLERQGDRRSNTIRLSANSDREPSFTPLAEDSSPTVFIPSQQTPAKHMPMPMPITEASRDQFGKTSDMPRSPSHQLSSSLDELTSPRATKPTEQVITWTYNPATHTWQPEEILVRMASEPFARGAMREAFHMVVCRPDGRVESFVAKRFTKEAEAEVMRIRVTEYGGLEPEQLVGKPWALENMRRRGTITEQQILERCVSDHMMFEAREFLLWFRRLRLSRIDCEMQGFCQKFAIEYNKHNPPKPVSFVDAFLVIFSGRPNAPVFSCEPFIEGKYVKHNNNAGEVPLRVQERNTPQAFSHFTYVCSKRQYVIIDIQGVGDTYTDPQVHSADGKGFGLGNLGQKGIDAFLQSHRCNNVCAGLGLTPLDSCVDSCGTHFRRSSTTTV